QRRRDLRLPLGRRTQARAPRAREAMSWDRIEADLDAGGCAVLPRLVAPEECAALASAYDDETLFRSRIVMNRHNFGQGEYKYFAYPLPERIAELRSALYPRLAAI